MLFNLSKASLEHVEHVEHALGRKGRELLDALTLWYIQGHAMGEGFLSERRYNYRKGSIKPPGGLFNLGPSRGGA